MKYQLSKQEITKLKTDALVIPVLQEENISDLQLPSKISNFIEISTDSLNDFKGKEHEIHFLSSKSQLENVPRILLIGFGKKEKYNWSILRDTFGKLVKFIKKYPIDNAAILGRNVVVLENDWSRFAQTVVEGFELGSYEFSALKSKPSEDESKSKLKNIEFTSIPAKNIKQVSDGLKLGKSISEAVHFARDLGNQPGNIITPDMLAKKASKLAEQFGLECTILSEKDMKRYEMGALLGVSKGSLEPSKLIVIQHKKGKKNQAPVVFVGKGVTFDSGGISIKPSKSMEEMKFDMSGGGNVLGIMRAVADLKLPVNAIGIIPAVENLPSGSAVKPGDILTSMSGKTIEVLNTDAEGRLILADALTYAERFNPSVVIDLATLTGSVVVALGSTAAGLMGNDESLMNEIRDASQISGEKVWPLPIFDEYKEQLKSEVCDLRNIGIGGAGSSVAGAFLGEFTQSYKWAHLDIAGVASTTKEQPISPKGSTGFGIRLLLEWLIKRKF